MPHERVNAATLSTALDALQSAEAAILAALAANRAAQAALAAQIAEAVPGLRQTGKRSRLDRDLEVAAWLVAHAPTMTARRLHAAAVERFGADRLPTWGATWTWVRRVQTAAEAAREGGVESLEGPSPLDPRRRHRGIF